MESELAGAQSSPSGSHHTDTDAKNLPFYTVCGSEATICKTVEQSVLPSPHPDVPIPISQGQRTQDPCPEGPQLVTGP